MGTVGHVYELDERGQSGESGPRSHSYSANVVFGKHLLSASPMMKHDGAVGEGGAQARAKRSEEPSTGTFRGIAEACARKRLIA